MHYIHKIYPEIKALVDEGYNVTQACKIYVERTGYKRSPEGMRKCYAAYEKQLDNLEVKTISYNSKGKKTSEKHGRSQQKDEIDLDKYEPTSFTTNPFGEGKWIRYDKILSFSPEKLKEELDKRKKSNYKIQKNRRTTEVGVFMLADFHLGAYVGDLLKTPDFNFGIVSQMIEEMSEKINSHRYKEVHLFLVGDFIESFSGLNHINSWKGLSRGAYGVQAIIFAHEILCEHLYSKVKNLAYVGFVSGNHDRVSSDKKEDQEGHVAMAMQYLFNKDFKKIESEWSPLLLSKVIDDIGYVVTHGHLGISSKEISKVIFDYGFQGKYNVFAKGHKHARETKKTFKKNLIKYQDIDYVSLDSADYRAVTIPPLFTGNFYSESLGYTTTAGMSHFVNNGKGKPNYIDYSI